MSELKVEIVSAEGHIHSGVAKAVFLPGEMGELGILPGHAPLLTGVRAGPIHLSLESGEPLFDVEHDVWVEQLPVMPQRLLAGHRKPRLLSHHLAQQLAKSETIHVTLS